MEKLVVGAKTVTILDWCAFTLPIAHTEAQPGLHAFRLRVVNVAAKMHEILPTVMQFSIDDLIPAVPQRPYRSAWMCSATGWRINADWKRKEALIVWNGGACEMLRKIGPEAAFQVLQQTVKTGTRLDLATDIPTVLPVKDVEKAGWAKRIRSNSFISSSTGDTLYVGSRSSPAFARVYRYAPPHPRSHLLRVEHELKKDQARAVAQIATVHGLESAQRSVAVKFNYQHPVLIKAFQGIARPIKTERHERTMANTEIWLMTQCAPAFQRLVRAGVIEDPAAWVKRYMLGDT